ncbi:MAG: hypothetical protein KGZ80_13915 [Methylomonas sp.]|nr:hypothetical protein [Methylomonas sp.]
MNTANNSDQQREHHFYVAIAKHVFEHPEHGVVFSGETISLSDAARFGLKPLILYGLTVPGTQLQWFSFSRLDNPRSFLGFLIEAWSKGSGLKGCPDILKINKSIADSCLDLKLNLKKLGVEVVVAEKGDKKLSGSLRAAQDEVMRFGWLARNNAKDFYNLEALNAYAHKGHNHHVEQKMWAWGSHKSVREIAEKWMALPVKEVECHLNLSQMDWKPSKWLSSWEVNAVPVGRRTFRKDDGVTWLIAGGNDNDYDGDESSLVEMDELEEACAERTKLVMDCWPNKPAEIANAIGITAKQLQRFVSKVAKLPEEKIDILKEMLGLEESERFYDFDAVGPCVLVGDKPTKITDVYELLTHGGDLAYSIEVIPEKGNADPSWRYVIFKACGELPNIIMFARGSKSAEKIGDKLLMNFDGVKSIPAAIYRDVVSTCAKACADPWSNRKKMLKFIERHGQFFDDFSHW